MQSEVFGARQKHSIGHRRGLLGPDGGCPWGREACLLNNGAFVFTVDLALSSAPAGSAARLVTVGVWLAWGQCVGVGTAP